MIELTQYGKQDFEQKQRKLVRACGWAGTVVQGWIRVIMQTVACNDHESPKKLLFGQRPQRGQSPSVRPFIRWFPPPHIGPLWPQTRPPRPLRPLIRPLRPLLPEVSTRRPHTSPPSPHTSPPRPQINPLMH